MSSFIPKFSRAILAGVVVLAIGACRGDQGPESAGIKRVDPNPRLYEYQDELFIVDDDGTEYKLNIPAREIRMSDGRVLQLDADQTALAIEAFYGVISTDPVAHEIQTNCLHPDGGGCPEPERPAEGAPQAPQTMWRRLATDARNDIQPGSTHHTPNYRSAAAGASTIFSFANASFTMSSNPCNDIATGAVAKVAAYFSGRTDFVKGIWSQATFVNGNSMVRNLPPGTGAAASFVQYIANSEFARIDVNILAFVWNSYYCSSRTVSGGTIFFNGGSGQAGGSVTCNVETWQISFDSGESWHNVDVTVCQYMT